MAPTKHLKHRPAVMTAVDIEQHPSLGNGHAYSHDFRLFCQHIRDTGDNGMNAVIQHAQRVYLYPSQRTLDRHTRMRLQLGHLRRFKKQGNRTASTIVCIELYMLGFWRTVWPKSTHAELNALLFNGQVSRGVPNPRFYAPSQLCRAEDRLGLSSVRGSTTAYQALLPRNLARRFVYWHSNYPAGIADILWDDVIDFDEAAIFVETANRKSGKSVIGVRVKEEGPYNHSEKYTLTMAISGHRDGERWVDFERKSGTTTHDTYQFVLRILRSIGRGTPQRRRLFTMDNLLAHKNRIVLGLIVEWGHRFCLRAPYYPIDGAIKYVFNTIQHELTICLAEIEDGIDLTNKIMGIIGAIEIFVNYFLNLHY